MHYFLSHLFSTVNGVAELFISWLSACLCLTHPKRLWHSSGQKWNAVLTAYILKYILKFKYEMRLPISFLLRRLCEQSPKQSVRGNPVCVCRNVLSSVNLGSFFFGVTNVSEIRNKSKTLIVRLWYIEVFGGGLFWAFLVKWINRLLNFYVDTKPLVWKLKQSSFISRSPKVFQKSRMVIDLWESEWQNLWSCLMDGYRGLILVYLLVLGTPETTFLWVLIP